MCPGAPPSTRTTAPPSQTQAPAVKAPTDSTMSQKSRVPLELQAVFLESARGGTVNKPPPSASRIFFRKLFGKGQKKKEESKSQQLKAPKPIIKSRTRIPLQLQTIFLASNRGTQVNQAAPTCASQVFLPKTTEKKVKPRRRLFFGRDNFFVFDKKEAPSHRHVAEGPLVDDRWSSRMKESSSDAPSMPCRRRPARNGSQSSSAGADDCNPFLPQRYVAKLCKSSIQSPKEVSLIDDNCEEYASDEKENVAAQVSPALGTALTAG